MRLRVVPGFISPPPGFGGLGYTPTARACVNISIPLQLRVIDMLDVFTPLLKLFANEPLERLMYTIIIFGLTLWLIPKEFTVAFNAYTEIPWLFQIIVFAFSFVVAISFSRLRAHIQKHYSLLPEQRVLLRLSEKEIAVFKDFLKTGNLIITSPCRNPVMKKLERKVLIAIVSTLSPNFFTINNLFNILQQTSVNAIMAVGMTLVILTSGIDLSVGSLLALTGAVAASIVGIEVNALVAVAAALALGAAIGAVTGVIVAKGRVQAFIATLVMMLLLRGVTMVYTNGSPVNTGFTENADLFGWFGIGRPLGVPTPVWIMGIVFLAAWYMLHHTRLGRYIYALGGNEAATRLSGINVNKIKIIVYSLCGLLASLAGIIEVARLSSAQPTAGTGYELDAIAAVVLGGTSLAGGKGRIVGTLIGALILGFLNNGLNLLGVSSYYQMIVKAVVILLAVLVDNKKQ